MGKKEEYRDELAPLLDRFYEMRKAGPLINYLLKKSNLPGPRANLELAEVLVDEIAGHPGKDDAWNLSSQLRAFTSGLAQTNDPKEFLCFCGVRLLGAIGVSSPGDLKKVLALLKVSAHDSRWRVREGVAMSIQMLIENDSSNLKLLEDWVVDQDWLGMRAVAAGVAEPKLMKKEVGIPNGALHLHKKIVSRVVKRDDAMGEEFGALKKTLGYSLSVVICGVPRDGFDYLRELAASDDKEIVWIVKENLKKNRLLSVYSDEVRSVSSILAS